MALEGQTDIYAQEDHQVAYIFDPEGDETRRERPSKRRRVSKQRSEKSGHPEKTSLFVPLLNGAESPKCVELRDRLFHESWDRIDTRIQAILRDSNSATLEEVRLFVSEARTGLSIDQIPCVFVITGPKVASQNLLFDQLCETLQQDSPSKFVKLRSSDASSLKATLKRIVGDVIKRVSDDDNDDLQVGTEQDGRRYLDYDLEALHTSIAAQPCENVFIAFQDSEGFDSSLLSELILLFSSWLPKIPFKLLFGIATSVELLQARLLKSACRLIHGAQFDVVQTDAILETVFKSAVAATDVPILIGAPLLRSILDRQHNQVAGIQAFISSLKYAYMCHFYANPLSLLLAPDVGEANILHAEHYEAMRNAPSFRTHIEDSIQAGGPKDLERAKLLIENDEYLLNSVAEGFQSRQQWTNEFLQALLVMEISGTEDGAFSRAYTNALEHGTTLKDIPKFAAQVRQLDVKSLETMLRRIIDLYQIGDPGLGIGSYHSAGNTAFSTSKLEEQLEELQALRAKAEAAGFSLHNKYSGRGKVMRTTVIAQRVQLSQDSADLRDEDKRLTEIIDSLVETLEQHIDVPGPARVLLSEGWLYDSRSPSRDIFVPRPRAVFERCLIRPFDYLACACCKNGEEGIQGTLPATSILYHLYLETGNLINVADLWSAFQALVSANDNDERKALVLFYQALAELRRLGFIRSSKKKLDHVAKLKWL